ncbi:capsid cement protein [Microbacterium dauci]|uniref:DUF2190 family protein n=1 Tax=Microbacterium dauci TaxID=3048008 RepID=A0ABT6ZAN6_9MICO|nr:capsid cement protein [Microbacterium sp. LX3-4]MDJ1113230.1 DUF2190 family protein [Microbacterium sp. LX3-4]
MADHIHLFEPGAKVTFTASDEITGGRLVEVTGNREVAHAAANSVKVVGAAARDTKDGEDVLVLRGGIQNLVASAAIAVGTRIKAAAAGKIQAVGAGENGIGITLTTSTAADQLVQVALDQ